MMLKVPNVSCWRLEHLLQEDAKRDYRVTSNNPEHCLFCNGIKAEGSFISLVLCGHRFCDDCIRDYAKKKILAGHPREIFCPHPECTGEPLLAIDLERVLGEDLYSRYLELLGGKTVVKEELRPTTIEFSFANRRAQQQTTVLELTQQIALHFQQFQRFAKELISKGESSSLLSSSSVSGEAQLLESQQTVKKISQCKPFLSWVETFVPFSFLHELPWSIVFHFRMLYSQDVLGKKQMQRFFLLFQCYLDFVRHRIPSSSTLATVSTSSTSPPISSSPPSSTPISTSSTRSRSSSTSSSSSPSPSGSAESQALYLSLVVSLVRFLEIHQMDPDGALIGLTPKKNLLKRHFPTHNSNQQISSSIDQIPNSLFVTHEQDNNTINNSDTLNNSSNSNNHNPHYYSNGIFKTGTGVGTGEVEEGVEKLLGRIRSWSTLDSPSVIGKEVLAFSALLRAHSLKGLKSGDIVLVRLEQKLQNQNREGKGKPLAKRNQSFKRLDNIANEWKKETPEQLQCRKAVGTLYSLFRDQKTCRIIYARFKGWVTSSSPSTSLATTATTTTTPPTGSGGRKAQASVWISSLGEAVEEGFSHLELVEQFAVQTGTGSKTAEAQTRQQHQPVIVNSESLVAFPSELKGYLGDERLMEQFLVRNHLDEFIKYIDQVISEWVRQHLVDKCDIHPSFIDALFCPRVGPSSSSPPSSVSSSSLDESTYLVIKEKLSRLVATPPAEFIEDLKGHISGLASWFITDLVDTSQIRLFLPNAREALEQLRHYPTEQAALRYIQLYHDLCPSTKLLIPPVISPRGPSSPKGQSQSAKKVARSSLPLIRGPRGHRKSIGLESTTTTNNNVITSSSPRGAAINGTLATCNVNQLSNSANNIVSVTNSNYNSGSSGSLLPNGPLQNNTGEGVGLGLGATGAAGGAVSGTATTGASTAGMKLSEAEFILLTSPRSGPMLNLTGNPTNDISVLRKIQTDAQTMVEKDEGEMIVGAAELLIIDKRKALLNTFKQLQQKKEEDKIHLAKYPDLLDKSTAETLRRQFHIASKGYQVIVPPTPSPSSSTPLSSTPPSSSSSSPFSSSSFFSPVDLGSVSGPGQGEQMWNTLGDAIGASVTSTYPLIQTNPDRRAGDPICDYFTINAQTGGRYVAVIADGCGWGKFVRDAAVKASTAFMEFLKESSKSLDNPRGISRTLLRALAVAHHTIIEGKETELYLCGTTTLLGGIVLPVKKELLGNNNQSTTPRSTSPRSTTPRGNSNSSGTPTLTPSSFTTPPSPADIDLALKEVATRDPSSVSSEEGSSISTQPLKINNNNTGLTPIIVEPQQHQPLWAFYFVSVGDCKCFLRKASTGRVVDVTYGNRNNMTTFDIKDPGGRLGPYSDLGEPDLRNLDMFCQLCEEGDILILMSDGVHDNLDPQQLHIPPHRLPNLINSTSSSSSSPSFTPLELCSIENWNELDCETSARIKNEQRCAVLELLIQGIPLPMEEENMKKKKKKEKEGSSSDSEKEKKSKHNSEKGRSNSTDGKDTSNDVTKEKEKEKEKEKKRKKSKKTRTRSSTTTTTVPAVVTPFWIASQLREHCLASTKNSREYLQTHPGEELPETDPQKLYRGKMDHSTTLCFRIGSTSSCLASPSSSHQHNGTTIST